MPDAIRIATPDSAARIKAKDPAPRLSNALAEPLRGGWSWGWLVVPTGLHLVLNFWNRMFNEVVNLGDVGHAIQLALAPAFLLTGIAGMLNVMAGRLARIIDRGRRLSEPGQRSGTPLSDIQAQELGSLERRRYIASAAITACTLAALLVCTVIASLFLQVLLALDLGWFIALLFTTATGAMVIGLGYFLREVHMATQSIRISSPTKRQP